MAKPWIVADGSALAEEDSLGVNPLVMPAFLGRSELTVLKKFIDTVQVSTERFKQLWYIQISSPFYGVAPEFIFLEPEDVPLASCKGPIRPRSEGFANDGQYA